MLIQCQTCNSKYRLNLERIPNRKAFIKCKKCNAPIYIDPQEDVPEPAGIIHPQGAAGGTEDAVVVHCDACNARYRVPVGPLRKPGLKLKCTRCGNMFPVPEGAVPPAPEVAAHAEGGPESATPEFFPAPGEAGEPLGVEGAGPEMPLPADSHVDSMFDDLQVDADIAAGGAPGTGEASREAERAYLEAVAIDESGGPVQGAGGGTIPDDQKYRFFLKPKEGEEAEPAAEAGEELPPLPDVQEEEGLPPLPEEHMAGASAAATESWAAGDEIPPFESEFPEETGMTDTTEMDTSLPPLVIDEEESQRLHNQNEAIPGQDPAVTRAEDRRFWAVTAVVVLLVLGTAGWGFWIWNLPSGSRAYSVREGMPAQLSVTTTRQGYFITNKPSGERLFVMTGQVVNTFAAKDRVGWVRLKGVAFSDGASHKQEGRAYVGNLLNDGQLASWELEAIRAYYGYNNGRNDSNLDIPQGKNIPYQIVLKGVQKPVTRSEAKVVSFMRRGRPVYVENF